MSSALLVLGSCATTSADVDDAVAAANAALDGPWGTMPVEERSALLHAVANEVDRRFDDFLAADTLYELEVLALEADRAVGL